MDTTPKSTGYYNSFDGTPIYYETHGEGDPFVLIYGIACPINHWCYPCELFAHKLMGTTSDVRGRMRAVALYGVTQVTLDASFKEVMGLMHHLKS